MSKRELDRRLERVVAEVAIPSGGPESSPEGEKLRPRRMSAAELVRRMRKFMVYN